MVLAKLTHAKSLVRLLAIIGLAMLVTGVLLHPMAALASLVSGCRDTIVGYCYQRWLKSDETSFAAPNQPGTKLLALLTVVMALWSSPVCCGLHWQAECCRLGRCHHDG